jgi:hypothetical protein
MVTKDELEAASRRWQARAAKYDPSKTWYDKTVLHLPAICEAVRRTMGTPAAQHAADLIWRLVLVEVEEFIAAGGAMKADVDSIGYGAVVLAVTPTLLEAIAEITPDAYPLNAYSVFMSNIDDGLREPWTRDGVLALRRLVSMPATGRDPAQEEPRETVLLGRALAHLTPEDARLVRKVVCGAAAAAGDGHDRHLIGVCRGGGGDAAGPRGRAAPLGTCRLRARGLLSSRDARPLFWREGTLLLAMFPGPSHW